MFSAQGKHGLEQLLEGLISRDERANQLDVLQQILIAAVHE